MTTTRTLTSAEIYWDSQDPNNEGWAYRVRFGDEIGHEESGPWDWDLPNDPNESQMAEAVAELCSQYGREIESGEVVVDLRTNGGHADWSID